MLILEYIADIIVNTEMIKKSVMSHMFGIYRFARMRGWTDERKGCREVFKTI